MKLLFKYKLTKNILESISIIETNRAIIDSHKLPVAIEANIRRKSILGSSLFSARIEGNKLTPTDISELRDITSREKQKIEVANLHRAITQILDKFCKPKLITAKDILNWHKIIMKNLPYYGLAGKWRVGHEGIFDSLGNAIYHAPPPLEVPKLIDDLLKFVNSDEEQNSIIRGVLAHLIFEKIHPFVDGSGRIGRLLQLAVMCTNNYAMKGFTSVEEKIDNRRSLYYEALEKATTKDATEFIELMLEFLSDASQTAKEKVLANKNGGDIESLSLRRQELYRIILEQHIVSMDFLHRRFLKVDERILRYDLKQLINEGLIKKIGSTRGALYAISR